MFCKSGILIFIFAENNYLVRQYICPPLLIKTPLLHQSFGPRVFSLSPSLSLSFFFRLILWCAEPSGFTFLPGLLRPSLEVLLHPIERALEAFMNRASPVSGTLLVFCVNQGISASFSFTFLSSTPDHQVH